MKKYILVSKILKNLDLKICNQSPESESLTFTFPFEVEIRTKHFELE